MHHPSSTPNSIAIISTSDKGCSKPGKRKKGKMLDKMEDIFQKRIRELENTERFLNQQLGELESDRNVLHEIARQDKATIHEQNVLIQELTLRGDNLCQQVSQLENSERLLFSRCSQLEDTVCRLEDRTHELEIHARRLQEQVRQLKLDEEIRQNKSLDQYETPYETPTEPVSFEDDQISIHKTIETLNSEKDEVSDREQRLEARVKELEGLETMLVQRLKNYEHVELTLHSHLQHAQSSEAAAYSKASELDALNLSLASRLQRAAEENALLSQHLAKQEGQIHALKEDLSVATQSKVDVYGHRPSGGGPLTQKKDRETEKEAILGRELDQRDLDLRERVQELEQSEKSLKEKVNQLQRSENRLLARLVEYETVGSQMLDTLPLAQRQQLPQTLEECQKRVIVLQRQLETIWPKLNRHLQQQQLPAHSNDGTGKSSTSSSTERPAVLEPVEVEHQYLLCQLGSGDIVDKGDVLQSQQLCNERMKSVHDSPRQTAKRCEDLRKNCQMNLNIPESTLSQTPHGTQPAQQSSATETHCHAHLTKQNADEKMTAPGAPSDLRVTRVDGNSMSLAWQPPDVDGQGCSNGAKVVGYRIYLNGRVRQEPHKPKLSHTKIEGVKYRRDRPQLVAIQTVAASGLLSPRVELIHHGVPNTNNSHPGDAKENGDQGDMFSILNALQYRTGQETTVVCLYDYDPEKQSPGDYRRWELAFHVGEVLVVYGEQRKDGFFHGEKNGRRGLVPACFVEPVAPCSSPRQKQSILNGSTSSRS